MFSNKTLATIFALVVALSLVLAACAPPTPVVVEKEVPVTVEKEVPVEVVVTPTPAPGVEKVTLDFVFGTEPPTGDPALATDTTSVMLCEQLFLGLTDFDDETSEVIPELATSWDVSDDGLTYTFHMRDDATWIRLHPGTGEVEEIRPVTAQDVEYGVKRTINPETASDYAYVLYIIKNAEELNTGQTAEGEPTELTLDDLGVKAIDDYTVQFTLEHPAGYFPAIAGMWVARPMPQEAIDEYGERWIEPGLIMTNGPYMLQEWVHGDHLILVKNPKWYDADKVQIEVLNGPIVMEASTSMSMYEAGEIDMQADPGWGVPLEDMDRVKADPVLSKELYIAPRLCTYYYGFTNTKPPFDTVLVRKAFSAAIDRKTLVETVTRGGQIPANTFACPGIFGNAAGDPDIAPWALDYELGKEKAKEWIAEAGYPDGEGLTDIVLMHNVSEGHRKIAEAILSMWKEVFPKAEIRIETQEWKVYLKTLKRQTPLEEMPHIWRLGWCADYPDQNNWVFEVFNCEAGANRLRRNCVDPTCTEVKPSEFDDLTRAAGIEQDPAKRVEMYKKAEKLLVEEEAAMAPIYYYTRVNLFKPYLTYIINPLGLDHIYKWKIDWEAKKAAKGM